MPRSAVIDSNLVVSLLLTGGTTLRAIFEAWRADLFEVVTSPAILAELRDVVGRAQLVGRWRTNPTVLLGDIERQGHVAAGRVVLAGVCRDPKDDKFLACAVEGRADYLVTGDADLLDLAAYEGVEIVTPRRFLAVLEVRADEPTG